MNGNYRVGDTVLGEWKLTKLLGQGSYGKVFEGEREDFGIIYKAAIKIITIPQSESEIQSTRAEGLDDASITAYFRSMVEEMVQEFALMSKLKGNSNIVSYEDHRVIPHSEGIGWDIIIRMECLKPMLDYMGKRILEPKEVAKVGVDMCRALELCEMHSIIHRDIKPENMFVNELGDFKLGDFGIARTIERGVSNMSKKGTYTYMAPEIYKEEPYNARVDIYSLGIVLYRLLNNNRAPFLPLTGPITHSQREQALLRRMSGAPLPPPCGASGLLEKTVMKACAYRPDDRWQTPGEMRRELERYLLDIDLPADEPEEEEEEEEGTVFTPPPIRRPQAPVIRVPDEEEEGTVSAFSSVPSVSLKRSEVSAPQKPVSSDASKAEKSAVPQRKTGASSKPAVPEKKAQAPITAVPEKRKEEPAKAAAPEKKEEPVRAAAPERRKEEPPRAAAPERRKEEPVRSAAPEMKEAPARQGTSPEQEPFHIAMPSAVPKQAELPSVPRPVSSQSAPVTASASPLKPEKAAPAGQSSGGPSDKPFSTAAPVAAPKQEKAPAAAKAEAVGPKPDAPIKPKPSDQSGPDAAKVRSGNEGGKKKTVLFAVIGVGAVVVILFVLLLTGVLSGKPSAPASSPAPAPTVEATMTPAPTPPPATPSPVPTSAPTPHSSSDSNWDDTPIYANG